MTKEKWINFALVLALVPIVFCIYGAIRAIGLEHSFPGLAKNLLLLAVFVAVPLSLGKILK